MTILGRRKHEQRLQKPNKEHFRKKTNSSAKSLILILAMNESFQPFFKFQSGQGKVDCWKELPVFMMGKSKHTLPSILQGILATVNPFTPARHEEVINMRDRLRNQLEQLLSKHFIIFFNWILKKTIWFLKRSYQTTHIADYLNADHWIV